MRVVSSAQKQNEGREGEDIDPIYDLMHELQLIR
jgi:hypothetical protein